MTKRWLTWTNVLLPLAIAEQPSSPKPIAAPMRDLPWGQLNFLQTTDTHGWHAGHLQEAQYSADWGDYISFAYRIREKADTMGVDVLVVDTGDRIEGNGLYDASDPKGEYTYDIFKEQNIDVLSTGNHELYHIDSAEREHKKTVPNFNGNYLASNLDYIKPISGEVVPMAQRFRKFTTKNQGIKVLAFGFLFDFTGNANNTIVQPVKETIQEKWFQDAIREDVDLFLVVGHVRPRGPEYKAIYQAIRSHRWNIPIQFFGGHSHIRDFSKYDSKAFALQSGRYMETIGWLSIDGMKVKGEKKGAKDFDVADSYAVKRRYIDNNLFGYHYHTGLNETTFPTEHGKNVSRFIRNARKSLELDYKFGCAPKDLWLNRAPYPSNDSLLTWLEKEVIPDMINNKDRKGVPTLAITNSGALRFDIFKGSFSRDTTYIVSPFVSKFKYLKDVPYMSAKRLLTLLNNNGPIFTTLGLHNSQLAPPEQMSILTDIIAPTRAHNTFRPGTVQSPLHFPETLGLIPGYTTKDDSGSDGDDTLHAPMSFYRVPNCIQSSISFPDSGDPETVDVVFVDFIQPWILLALQFLGERYTKADVGGYTDETLTQLMADWIKVNWGQNC
ncbi:calcineurin-like phosphoesterase [Diplocarpon rosae]|nr:calcineurin-like phosphoesterase [Diplocarpon rosae]